MAALITATPRITQVSTHFPSTAVITPAPSRMWIRITKQYGAAHRAFLLVPLVGGFFIDIFNAVAINFLANL
jgi:sodium--glutamate symport carrier gltS